MRKYFKTFFPQDEILGIDIGSYAIKYVLFGKNNGKIILKNWGYTPLSIPDNTEPAERKNIISEEISSFVKKSGIKTRYAATSVSGNSVIIRYIKIPKIDKKELADKITIEAEAFIPFDINEVYLSYYIVNNNVQEEGQIKMEVVLVAAKKEVIDEKIDILKNAGLLPVLIDIDSFALENLINFIEEEPKDESKSIMIANVGHKVTNLSILVNNLLIARENKELKPEYYSKLVRDIFIAGSSIDRAISKKMNVDITKVDELKKSMKILVTDEDKLKAIQDYDTLTISATKIMSGVLKEMVGDITRSIDFFASSGLESTISKLYICGGSSAIENINLYIYDEIKIPVEFVNPFSFVENKPANIGRHILNSLCVAAGLSLRSIKSL
ncbi:MAG: type IV pilus assembly protein PilM [Elusimicrobiota bacterium]